MRAAAQRSASAAVRVGIGDDCAVLTPRSGEELVITTDFSIEDRHFYRAMHPPEAVGHKCLARGLSDVAAMGARPVAAFVSLALPRKLALPQKQQKAKTSWVSRFYAGLLALAEREHVTLAGGDLSESPTLAFADIIVVGAVPKGRALLRSGARPGDILYVTGSLGGAAAELATLDQRQSSSMMEQSNHPHFYPQPRVAAGRALMRRRLATACIDISDGLSTDLLHLCEESHLSAELHAKGIPLASWNGSAVTLEQALHGGDDYELLFTASPRLRMPSTLGGVTVQPIGRMISARKGSRVTLITTGSQGTKRTRLRPQGWQHF